MTKREQIIIDELDETINSLVFWSFRYFNERNSIHAHVFKDRLNKVLPLLDEKHRKMILEERGG